MLRTRPEVRALRSALSRARQVLHAEASAIELAASRLDESFAQVVEQLWHTRGRVAVVGVGKSADIGQKLVGTFNSTGTRAYALDATRAVHGDLGMVHPDDVALLLSHSGESEELVRLLGPLRQQAAALVAITGNAHGTLAQRVDAAIVYGPLQECCPLALAPSASTTVMLALGDALAFVLLEARNFTADDFARYHPAGSLGRKLAVVEAIMRTGAELRTASADATVRSVFALARPRGRRSGAVLLLEADGTLAGLFTDSDLARLFERRHDTALDEPIRNVMTAEPFTIPIGTRLSVALDLLRAHKISELPVLDEAGKPVGMLDITDVLGLVPADAAPTRRPHRESA
jgi:arabinose-5-phosphate isomerase